MPAPTLLAMCHRAANRNVRFMDSLGTTPAHLLTAFLLKVENPDQLQNFERESPQIIGHTRDAWINLLRRDIPNVTKKLPPNWETTLFSDENAHRWYKIYRKLERDHKREMEEQQRELAAQLARTRNIREKAESSIVHAKPLTTTRNRSTYGNARFNLNKDLYADSTRNKAAGSNGFFEKLNRNVVSKQSVRMRTPTHKLKPVINNDVKAVPMKLVEDARERREREEKARQVATQQDRARKEAESLSSVRAPRYQQGYYSGVGAREPSAPLHGPKSVAGQPYDLTRDREARLRNLKNGTAKQSKESAKIAQLTTDFLEDYDDSNGGEHNHDFGGSTHDSDRDSFGDYDNSNEIDDEELFGGTASKKQPAIQTISRALAPSQATPVKPQKLVNPLTKARPPTLSPPSQIVYKQSSPGPKGAAPTGILKATQIQRLASPMKQALGPVLRRSKPTASLFHAKKK